MPFVFTNVPFSRPIQEVEANMKFPHDKIVRAVEKITSYRMQKSVIFAFYMMCFNCVFLDYLVPQKQQ